MASYFLCMELTDGTCDKPFYTLSTKKAALRVARQLAKESSLDCVRIWVDNSEGVGVASFRMQAKKD